MSKSLPFESRDSVVANHRIRVLWRAYLALGVKYKVILLFAITCYFGGSPSSRVKVVEPALQWQMNHYTCCTNQIGQVDIIHVDSDFCLKGWGLITEPMVLFFFFFWYLFYFPPPCSILTVFKFSLGWKWGNWVCVCHFMALSQVNLWHSVWFLVQDTAIWKRQTVLLQYFCEKN